MSVKPHVWLPSVRAGSGGDVYVQRLAEGLRRAGVTVSLEWFDHRFELIPWLLSKKEPPPGVNVIHANAGCAFAFARWNLPLVVTDHHYVLDPAYRPFKSLTQSIYHRVLIGRFLRASYKSADLITADSQFTADVLRREAGIKVDQVIPLWVDYDEFAPPEDSGLDSYRPFTLLFVGNSSRRKGADVIPAMARALGDGFEIQCTSGLRSKPGRVEEGNVTSLGRLDDASLRQAYARCDAVLSTSRYEGFGYSVLEGMACGKPVIAFACGAVDELIVEGETGFLVPVDDIAALVQRARRLAEDPGAARAMGTAGRARAVGVFNEAKGISAYICAYEVAMARAAR